ncbi:hypothetical protein PY093_11080 [Cytobacillus sp. S13-E01]|uniref:hypothetical protein n=1 Tax=Cytobacillus sp. S13-E01 TaxID=3031326 RepID=UPI0023D85E21|nr:hypothetical protein [Cytobacillus sp. S13-E01]MDF0727241.1 hypothetical protein [Cytobacillus sp. S13-E01]
MQNIGVEFKLRVYSQRWGHRDNYNLTKTENGWAITTNKLRGLESDKHGSPGIEKAFTSESISYPHDIGYFLSDIWDASQNRSVEEVQGYFDQLADWISKTEESKPNFGPLHL